MRTILLWAVGLYKRCISPFLPPACRFEPTCSEYAREAIILHGAFKGSCLALWRLLRCNPLFKGGFDPVPEPRRRHCCPACSTHSPANAPEMTDITEIKSISRSPAKR